MGLENGVNTEIANPTGESAAVKQTMLLQIYHLSILSAPL